MAGIFRFKEFDVDQKNCGMKINTDGVLLGAITGFEAPEAILDIGTGTGVIALMLAQRFPDARIDAIEIDKEAAATASRNFKNSPFSNRLQLYEGSFRDYLGSTQLARYDFIVSNPPFFISSLKNPDPKKQTARHTDHSFFIDLVFFATRHLSPEGLLSLIIPLDVAEKIEDIASRESMYVHQEIDIKSFPDSQPHRKILTFGLVHRKKETKSFVIYQEEKQYSEEYRQALKNFLTIF